VSVRIHGRNMHLEDELKRLVEDKIERASRILDGDGDVDVEFTEHTNPRQSDGRYEVEITSVVAGHVVRVESAAFDARTAFETASDRYERQLRRLKERLVDRRRARGNHDNKALNAAPEQDEEEPDRTNAIVREKRFAMKPMTVEEAVLQMEMLGHDFFFFLDGETGRYAVLYHRRDGNLGLIEPE